MRFGGRPRLLLDGDALVRPWGEVIWVGSRNKIRPKHDRPDMLVDLVEPSSLIRVDAHHESTRDLMRWRFFLFRIPGWEEDP